jgi:hypothetical protein
VLGALGSTVLHRSDRDRRRDEAGREHRDLRPQRGAVGGARAVGAQRHRPRAGKRGARLERGGGAIRQLPTGRVRAAGGDPGRGHARARREGP